MTQRDIKKPLVDTDSSDEEVAQEFDGTRTDPLNGKYRVHVVSASEADSGTVEFDDRGQSRWKYNDNQPTRNPDTTFDLLKALENAAILIEEEEPAPPAPEPKPEPGYNPYDTAPAKPRRKK